MELMKSILEKNFPKVTVKLTNRQARRFEKVLASSSYQALKKIREIIKNETFTDEECFSKIEAVVCAFEKIGSNGGGRHDFG